MSAHANAPQSDAFADEVWNLIRSRRSAGRFDAERMPPRALIERLLEACTYAPNHHMTQPWRFRVITGSARKDMGELLRRLILEDAPAASEDVKRQAEVAARKPLRSPVIVLVACAVDAEAAPRRRKEDYAACAAGVENMLLLAQAMGLVAKWSTGGVVDDQRFKRHYGFAPTDEILAALYIGYADALPATPPRRPVQEFVQWLE